MWWGVTTITARNESGEECPAACSADAPTKMSTMPATAPGLCEFIDASPSPFHVCATVAQTLTAAGYVELAEADAWPSAGRR